MGIGEQLDTVVSLSDTPHNVLCNAVLRSRLMNESEIGVPTPATLRHLADARVSM